ncbi:MAG TPA: MmcQ/YjbR family DNA-binding protein [Planctomycetota bacterium]
MTPDQFRRLALSMPGAVEGSHHDHPDFRANGRIFASLLPDGERGMVRLSPQQQREVVPGCAGEFEPGPGAWGRAGCTYVHLEVASAEALRPLMTLAWQEVVQQPPAKRAAKGKKAPGKTRGAKGRTKRAGS